MKKLRKFPCNDHHCQSGWSHEVEMTKDEAESYDESVEIDDDDVAERKSLEDWLYHYPELDNKYTSCPDCGSN